MAHAFRFEELDGKIGLVTFDLPDKKVNTLSQEVLKELASLVGELEKIGRASCRERVWR